MFSPPNRRRCDIVLARVSTRGGTVRIGRLSLVFCVCVLTAADTVPIATFNAPRAFPVGYPILSIAVADFDGDGTPDVAALTEACEYCQGFVSILLNNGHGGYQPERNHPVGTSFLGAEPESIVAADFNGDGRPDL